MTTLRLPAPNTVNETASQGKTHDVRAHRFSLVCRCATVNSRSDLWVSYSKNARSSQT
jgi:hypothetical protein